MHLNTYKNLESGNTFLCSVIDVSGHRVIRVGHIAIRNMKTGRVSVGRMFPRKRDLAIEVGGQYRDRLNTEHKNTIVQMIAVVAETKRMAFVPVIGDGPMEVLQFDRWPDDIREMVDRRVRENIAKGDRLDEAGE